MGWYNRPAPWLAIAFAAMLAPTLAYAGNPSPSPSDIAVARDLFAKAEKDEEGGRWADALEKLKRASAVKMTPGIRFHVALCEENLGQLTAALADYTAAQSQAMDEHNQEVLQVVAQPLTALRSRLPTLAVNVPADAKNANVTVDGAPLAAAQWGTPVPIDPGSHVVQASLAGRETFTVNVAAPERSVRVVDVKLPAVVAAQSPAEAPRTAVMTSAPQETRRSRTGALLATGGAVVLAGAGVAAFLVAGSKQSDARAECATRTGSCSDLAGPVRTFDWLALGAWAGAAIATGVALVLWTRASDDGRRASARLVVGPGAAALAGAF